MPWRERGAWLGSAALAVPAAWAIARLGHGLPSAEPARELTILLLQSAAEEIVFRGGLQTWLATRLPRRMPGLAALTPSNLLTSTVFAAAHLWQHAPVVAAGVFPISLLLGASLERSGRLWVPVALHAWFNLALYLASWAQRVG